MEARSKYPPHSLGSIDTARAVNPPIRPSRHKKSSRSLLLSILLAVLCVGGTELAFCRFFSPVLFQQITEPVVRPVIAAADAARAQIDLWRFQYQRDNLSLRVLTPAGEYFTPRPVVQPRPWQPVDFPEPAVEEPLEEAPAITEFIQEKGRTILTGGLPCVYYNQNDPAWKDKPFGSDPIGPYGCGPTAMAIVVSSMTEQQIDPAQMSVWAYEHDYWCSGSGSYLTIVEGTAKAFGLDCVLSKQCDAKALAEHLDGGGLAVALMAPGHFTDSGHFIVLHGVAPDGKFLVADTASRERSLSPWDSQLIIKEAAASNGDGVRLWLISQPKDK
ncbi:MAG: hypothetical protein HFE95_01320 [Acutalibacter sp.]|jgi:hypothetical protein|nr:hypothetical protein [Acutalibacter sp.]